MPAKPRGADGARSSPLPLLAPIGLALVTLIVFWSDLVRGTAFYGSDTVAFYYPLTSWYAGQLKAGHLPLWLPYIFGGYPLFADGEVGMLYPLNLLAYGLLPNDIAFVWLRPLHFWLASLFAFWLGRLLGLSRFGALLAAITFSYGSFLVAHLQHENLIHSAIWLPLALALMELALRASARRRIGYLLGCGVVVGIQMLGVHVQPVLLTLLALGLFALLGPMGPGKGERRPTTDDVFGDAPAVPKPLGDSPSMSRPFDDAASIHPPDLITSSHRLASYLVSRLLVIAVVAAAGAGLAAVQLLPLYELSQISMRLGSVSFEFATSYSVPPIQLIQLVLPYFFRPDSGAYWGLWGAGETTIYLGIAPLLLVLVALAYPRNRTVILLGLIAGLSLLVALGDYLPFGLYGLVWSLPGFSLMRVPARFSLLFVLAGALLAGFGADRLTTQTFRRSRRHLFSGVRRIVLLALVFGLGALALGALFALARTWLEMNSSAARATLEAWYLTPRRGDWRLTSSTVYFGLLRSLDLANPRTVGALVLMLLAALWCAMSLLQGPRRLPRRLWQAGLITLVTVDLALFAQGFYPQKPVGALKLSSPAVRFLADHNGLHRVFIEPILFGQLGPNQLVGSEIDFASGYSSLEPRRATEYWWSVVRQDDALLDLYNIRYIVSPRSMAGLLSYEGTLFHPADRLMHGAVGNPSGTETFQFEPWWTEALSVVAAGERLRDVPVGTPLAEIVIRGQIEERHLLLRSGENLEDSAAPLVGPPKPGTQFGPRIAWTGPLFQNPFQLSTIYGSTLRLDQPLLATSLTVQLVGPRVAIDFYGLGLQDRPGLPVRSLMPTDRAKYRQVYQDDDVRILENTSTMPRAFLVDSARMAAGSRTIVEQLGMGSFDPRHTILLDGASGEELGPGTSGDDVGSAIVLEHSPERVVVRVEAQRRGYLVLDDRYEEGWRVRVDGRDAQLLRADAMFRAVNIDVGLHDVVFSYEPSAVRTGAVVSLATLGLIALVGFWCVLARRAATGDRRRHPASTSAA